MKYFYISKIDSALLDNERARVISELTEIVPKGCLFEIGSTAVEGVIGKQDLDFLVRVPTNDFLLVRAELDNLFKRNSQQLSNDVYQGYCVVSEMDIAIQLTIADGPFDNFIAFISALQNDIQLRDEYNNLKMKYDGRLMADYRDAKHDFIVRVLESRNKE